VTTETHPLWPLFDLRIRSERLVLRLPTDDDLVELAALAKAGIHGPDEMPFAFPWSTLPSPEFERGFVQYHWLQRATWSTGRWELVLGVELDGRLVGSQGIEAENFSIVRTVATGSWLSRPFQGRGIGREMREAVLAFAFEDLGAEVATTQATIDNAASNAISRRLGYRPNGFGRLAPGGRVKETQFYRMTRDEWADQPRLPIRVDGFERCRGLFGLDASEQA
jgi:RimJ/RimL family protein N-acetyltransferase